MAICCLLNLSTSSVCPLNFDFISVSWMKWFLSISPSCTVNSLVFSLSLSNFLSISAGWLKWSTSTEVCCVVNVIVSSFFVHSLVQHCLILVARPPATAVYACRLFFTFILQIHSQKNDSKISKGFLTWSERITARWRLIYLSWQSCPNFLFKFLFYCCATVQWHRLRN